MGGQILDDGNDHHGGAAGKLTTTGKLGDVMQESAHAAMSYVREPGSTPWGCRKTF